MDSVTQFLLGASVSGAILGPRIGAKSLLIGGLVATLPDLDVIPAENAIDNMTYHRGFSHSVIIQTIAAPVIAWGVVKFVKPVREYWNLTMLTVWLCLITHSLLDSLTTYGTQIFWPLNIGPPVAYPAVFIIDPIYTILLLISVATIFFRRQSGTGYRLNLTLITISCVYLSAGMIGHQVVKARAESHPAYQEKEIFVQPTAFNILFWQVLGVDNDSYVNGMTSLLQDCSIVDVRENQRKSVAPVNYELSKATTRLHWFTDGFYSYQETEDGLSILDLRIGYPPFFPFEFKIASKNGKGYSKIDPLRLETNTQDRASLMGELIENTVEACSG
jgi:inner membrane protein